MKKISLQFSDWIEPKIMNILGIKEYKGYQYMLLQEEKTTDNKVYIVHYIPDEKGENFDISPVYEKDTLEHFAGILNQMLLKERNKSNKKESQ